MLICLREWKESAFYPRAARDASADPVPGLCFRLRRFHEPGADAVGGLLRKAAPALIPSGIRAHIV